MCYSVGAGQGTGILFIFFIFFRGRQAATCRFLYLFSILECAGVDLPPGQRESAVAAFVPPVHGGGADISKQKVMKEELMLHKLKVKPKDGGTAIFIDKKELRGVQGLVLNMGVNSIPTVYLEMNVALIDVEVDDAYVIREEK